MSLLPGLTHGKAVYPPSPRFGGAGKTEHGVFGNFDKAKRISDM